MAAMLMVQTPIHNIVNVIAMWDRFVSTALTVNVRPTVMSMIADSRIGIIHLQAMLIIMPMMLMVQMSIVQIVNVVIVANGSMSAIFAMNVVVVGVGGAAHCLLRCKIN